MHKTLCQVSVFSFSTFTIIVKILKHIIRRKRWNSQVGRQIPDTNPSYSYWCHFVRITNYFTPYCKTWLLTFRSSTASPTASTSPAHSKPMTKGTFGGLSMAPWRTIKSVKLRPLQMYTQKFMERGSQWSWDHCKWIRRSSCKDEVSEVETTANGYAEAHAKMKSVKLRRPLQLYMQKLIQTCLSKQRRMRNQVSGVWNTQSMLLRYGIWTAFHHRC